MSQKFNFMDYFSERAKFMVDLPRNKDAILSRLEQLHAYELKHPRVHLDESNCEFGWLCDTLIQTYNTSVLDVSDPTFKDACIEQAHKCAYEENDAYGTYQRTVLSQLILNHSNQNDPTVPKENKKPITDFIGGPKTLTMHWSKKYKKLIYIFGEHHEEKTDCEKFKSLRGKNQMLIEDYLLQLFKNSDVFIDFYLETGRENKDIDGKRRIKILSNVFKNCLHNPNTKENENGCKLSRMHYFDVRKETSDLKPDPMSFFCWTMGSLIYSIDAEVKDNMDLPKEIVALMMLSYFLNDTNTYDTKIKPVLQEFSEIKIDESKDKDDEKYSEYQKFWDKQIEEHTFVAKKVVKSTIHEEIKSFIKKEMCNAKFFNKKIDIKTLIKTVKEFIITVNKYKINGEYDFINYNVSDLKILINLEFVAMLITINAYITDYYLLCRIFKVFDFTKLKNHRWTDEPEEPHNIIIYAGDLHSENVRKFLQENLGFKMISDTQSRNGIDNCISMLNFPQPFFSNHKKVKWSDELEEEEEIDDDDDLYS